MVGNNFLIKKAFANEMSPTSKSILPKYSFLVTFIDRYGFSELPQLQSTHVSDITIPNYNFNKESVKYGPLPKSFPIFDYDGLELTITFEEDKYGTVTDFVNSMMKRVVNDDGTYNPPNIIKISKIITTVQNREGIPVIMYIFSNCFILDPGTVDYSYESNESVKIPVTFNADYYDVIMLARGVTNSIKNLAFPFNESSTDITDITSVDALGTTNIN